MKAYKVLSQKNKRLYSYIVTGNACTRYQVKKTTKPKFPKAYLMAFDSLESVKDFCCCGLDEEVVYEVEVKLAPKEEWPDVILEVFKGSRLTQFLTGWTALNAYGLRTGCYKRPPTGTLFCEEITLIKRVELEYT